MISGLVSVITVLEPQNYQHLRKLIEQFNEQDWTVRELVVVNTTICPVPRSNGYKLVEMPGASKDAGVHAAVGHATGIICTVWMPDYPYPDDALRTVARATKPDSYIELRHGNRPIAIAFYRRSWPRWSQLKCRWVGTGHPDPEYVFTTYSPQSRNGPWPDRRGLGDPECLNVMCPAGIGDVLWVLGKFARVARERPVTFWFPEGESHRAGGIARLAGVNYGYLPGLSTSWVWSQPGQPFIPEEKNTWIVAQANRHLENGHSLKKWYPQLPLEYPKLRTYYGPPRAQKYVVGFMCLATYMGGQLTPQAWGEIFQYINDNVAPVIIVGAGEDVSFAREVERYYKSVLPGVYNAPLEEVTAIVKGSCATVGVASGLLITSIVMKTPSLISYPRHLDKMPGTWEPEDAAWDWCFQRDLPDVIRSGRLEKIIAKHETIHRNSDL